MLEIETEIAKQVISKERVVNHGEVLTAAREVSAMLDLVKSETERIDSRFLEPACGTGNFLVEILKRKLSVVEARYAGNQNDFERYSILAISSIYGVDIQQDNVQTCRDRLLGIYTHFYLNNYKTEIKSACLKAAEFILSRNILWGDALSLKTPDESAQPIVFSEWSAISGNMIKRRDYTMANLLESQPLEGLNLFSDLGDQAFIPTPVGEYPMRHYLKICDEPDQL
jgi:hypothetical protein